MVRASIGRLARWSAWVILALGLLAPASVDAAGCSLDGHSGATVGHFDRLADAGAIPQHGGPSRPKPCSGAFCSEGQTAPSSPAPWSPSRISHWGCLTDRPALPDPHARPQPADDPADRPARLGSGIFHPPRLV